MAHDFVFQSNRTKIIVAVVRIYKDYNKREFVRLTTFQSFAIASQNEICPK
jgi:hypothetical protein